MGTETVKAKRGLKERNKVRSSEAHAGKARDQVDDVVMLQKKHLSTKTRKCGHDGLRVHSPGPKNQKCGRYRDSDEQRMKTKSSKLAEKQQRSIVMGEKNTW